MVIVMDETNDSYKVSYIIAIHVTRVIWSYETLEMSLCFIYRYLKVVQVLSAIIVFSNLWST